MTCPAPAIINPTPLAPKVDETTETEEAQINVKSGPDPPRQGSPLMEAIEIEPTSSRMEEVQAGRQTDADGNTDMRMDTSDKIGPLKGRSPTGSPFSLLFRIHQAKTHHQECIRRLKEYHSQDRISSNED